MNLYIPQQDDVVIEEAHLEAEQELCFDDMDNNRDGEAYRFTDTLTLGN